MARTAIALVPLLALQACGTDESTPDDGSGGSGPAPNQDGDCLTDAEEATLGTDPALLDSDADTISDCDEIALGTNPTLADTDADGASDSQETACVSDPLDGAEKCYACGWKHNDPGNLVATGSMPGNIIGDMQVIDQCQETVSLWDFAATAASPVPAPADYHILFMTAAW
jgi:hypothetical protein